MRNNLIIVLLIVLIVLVFIDINKLNIQIIMDNSTTYKELEKRDKYLNCMNEAYQSNDLDNAFANLFQEYQNTGIAIYFKEINNDYSYSLNEDKIYYSASTIKLFDTIYLIEQARNGLLNLQDTITYTPNYQYKGSSKTKTHKLYDKIPIIDLIDYELSVSDNSAHIMLVDYIGINNLNTYFKDINLRISTDYFSNYYNASVANYSLERIYNILQVNDEYSELLKQSLNNTYYNGLNFDEETFLHKYGWTDMYYHDLGIYESDNPYLISILTLYGNSNNYLDKTKDISKKIYNIYRDNLIKKKEYCLSI